MYCAQCGDCCKRMSPFSEYGEPCKHLHMSGNVAICKIYSMRPDECKNHTFPCGTLRSGYCPIGCDVLGLHNATKIEQREMHAGLVTNAERTEHMREWGKHVPHCAYAGPNEERGPTRSLSAADELYEWMEDLRDERERKSEELISNLVCATLR
jgi:hypothetical protein